MKTNLIIVCETCGEELNVTDTVCDITNRIKFTVQPCANKKCNKDFCANCEDVQNLSDKLSILEQRIRDANLIMIPIKRKLKLVELPDCFGERDAEKAKKEDCQCKDECGYVEECIEKTAVS